MAVRVKVLVALVLLAATTALIGSTRFAGHDWIRFTVYLAVVLLISGMKVPLPRGDSTMSVNFPFVLLSLVQLSLPQALALAALSVFAQCNFRVQKNFTAVQIAFNVGNAINATAGTWLAYTLLLRMHLAAAPAVSLAAVVYFLASTIPVALIIGWTNQKPVYPLWTGNFLWYLPFYLFGAALAGLANFLSIRYGWPTSLLILPIVYTIYRSYMSQIIRVRDRQQHFEEMEALSLRAIEGLAMAIEARDQSTHDHLLRVRVYVAEIGAALQLSRLEIQAVVTAALLHDIGKLAVPDHIINKPGKLTQEEFEKIKIHPVVGAEILERVRFPYPVVPIVRSHHEWWNGMGYPDGLAGEAIPIGARILTVVDCFDALASDRPYRLAMPIQQAMAMIKKGVGTQFDPRVVAVFEQRYVELEARARVEGEKLMRLNTGIAVKRGLVPGAGFEQDSSDVQATLDQAGLSPSGLAPSSLDLSGLAQAAGRTPARTQPISSTGLEALDLIAAASQEAQALFEMTQSLGNSLRLDEAVSLMTSRLRALIAFDCSVVYLKKDRTIIPQHIHGESARFFSSMEIPLGQGVSGWVAQSGRPIVNGNASVEPNFLHRPDSPDRTDPAEDLQSALSVPLLDLEGDVFGVLTLYAKTANAFSRDHLRILQVIETKFSLALRNAMRFYRPEFTAHADFLTELPNTRGLFSKLEAGLAHASRTGESLAIVVCDLNSFKSFNDRRGHLAGNLLLGTIADGFRRCCRPLDTVARLGGDEFVFLIPGVTPDIAASRLEKIAHVVSDASRGMEAGTPVSASVGAAFYPSDATTAEELLALADRRMYLHKREHYEALEKSALRFPSRRERLSETA